MDNNLLVEILRTELKSIHAQLNAITSILTPEQQAKVIELSKSTQNDDLIDLKLNYLLEP